MCWPWVESPASSGVSPNTANRQEELFPVTPHCTLRHRHIRMTSHIKAMHIWINCETRDCHCAFIKAQRQTQWVNMEPQHMILAVVENHIWKLIPIQRRWHPFAGSPGHSCPEGSHQAFPDLLFHPWHQPGLVRPATLRNSHPHIFPVFYKQNTNKHTRMHTKANWSATQTKQVSAHNVSDQCSYINTSHHGNKLSVYSKGQIMPPPSQNKKKCANELTSSKLESCGNWFGSAIFWRKTILGWNAENYIYKLKLSVSFSLNSELQQLVSCRCFLSWKLLIKRKENHTHTLIYTYIFTSN